MNKELELIMRPIDEFFQDIVEIISPTLSPSSEEDLISAYNKYIDFKKDIAKKLEKLQKSQRPDHPLNVA